MTLAQVELLAAAHAADEHDRAAADEVRLMCAVRVAVWGDGDAFARAIERRQSRQNVAGTYGDDGLAAALAAFGVRLED